jgi:hypothetical protein
MAVPIKDQSVARMNSPPSPDADNHILSSPTVGNANLIKDDDPAIDGYYSMNLDAKEDQREPYTPTILNRLATWYSHQMDNYPVTTKSAFGGCSSILGDVLAQCIENNTALREEPTEGLYGQRILAMFSAGLCFGPMLHYIYEFYEHVLPIDFDEQCLSGCIGEEDDCKLTINDDSSVVELSPYFCHSTMFHSFYAISNRKNVNAFLHVAIDQGIMAFAYVAVLMVVTGIVEGRWNELGEEFQHDYMGNVHAMWLAALMFTGPIQMVAFRYLPLKWRTLAVNVLEVFEVMVMSYITHRNREVPNQA